MSIDLPEIIEDFPDSHPRGFIKEFKKRRTTIVETYLRITKSLNSVNHKERIHALRLLAEHIYYSRSLKMPLNAARVQLALMKQVVNNRGNKRLQLELMHDFTVSSFGHPRTIKKYLKKLDIIEVPETGEELQFLNMGWDSHVHDNASYGRKSPIQLVIDAFIKGISKLTIAYNNLEHKDAVKEVLEAGKILGIKVNIAIEFSAETNGKQFHYMYILPKFSSRKNEFKRFLKHKSDHFDAFLYELNENQKKRYENISYLINRFNKEHLPTINTGYDLDSIYYLKPLPVEQENEKSTHKIKSRRLLGEYLYPRFKTVLEKRLLQISALKNLASHSGEFTLKEIKLINKKYDEIKKDYAEINPESLRLKYFADNNQIKSETAVSSLHEIYNLAVKAGGGIKFIQPLEHGLEAAIVMILDNYEYISHTEIFNMFDSIKTDKQDFIHFSNFIKYLNDKNFDKLSSLLDELNIKADIQKLKAISKHLNDKKLSPSIGSDATGRSTFVPGMGFIFENRLAKYQRKYFLKHHMHLPKEVSELVFKQPQELARIKKGINIICLGKVDSSKNNEFGKDKNEKPIKLFRAIEYINPSIKNLFLVLVGLLPAYFTIGIEYALLWFAITGTRNIFVDMISGKGFKPSEWSTKDIDVSNLANSLFWTGFSVPILGFVKSRFDILWQWQHEGNVYEFAKFFFINTANGMYLASHNYIRGFDKGTIRGNFFRSILAWPIAAAFSPLGNTMMLPSIVQAKFWSDFVAAIIEGTGKYKNIIQLKERIIKSLLPDLESEDEESKILAILDFTYFIKESTRVKPVIRRQLIQTISIKEKCKNILKHKKTNPEVTIHYNNLSEWFRSKDNFDKLCNYIIQNYNNEQTLYILQLVSSNYSKTSRWLEKIKP